MQGKEIKYEPAPSIEFDLSKLNSNKSNKDLNDIIEVSTRKLKSSADSRNRKEVNPIRKLIIKEASNTIERRALHLASQNT